MPYLWPSNAALMGWPYTGVRLRGPGDNTSCRVLGRSRAVVSSNGALRCARMRRTSWNNGDTLLSRLSYIGPARAIPGAEGIPQPGGGGDNVKAGG